MSNKNFSCPVCKEKLLVSQEHGFDKEQFINSKTGIPEKRIKIRHWGAIDTPISFKCSNHDCNFEYYQGGGNDFFEELIDIILSSELFKCNE